jgi:hypothetical protein
LRVQPRSPAAGAAGARPSRRAHPRCSTLLAWLEPICLELGASLCGSGDDSEGFVAGPDGTLRGALRHIGG